MKFVVDAQLPSSLVQWFTEHGQKAVHVEDIGLRDAVDDEIWNYALKEKVVILTKDEDFASRCARSTQGPVVVWLHLGNCSNQELFQWMEKLWPQLLTLLTEKNRLIELRRESSS